MKHIGAVGFFLIVTMACASVPVSQLGFAATPVRSISKQDTGQNRILAQARERYSAGELDQAQILFTQVLDEEGFSGEFGLYLGLISLQQEQEELALQWFRSTLEAEPTCAECWNNLGIISLERGMYRDAKQQFEKSLEFDSGLWQARLNLGTLLEIVQQPGEAVAAYREALADIPGPLSDPAVSVFVEALDAQQKGHSEDAIRLYKVCLGMDPELLNAYWQLGRLYMQQGFHGSAHEVFLKAARIDSNSQLFPVGIGSVFLALRNFTKAESVFTAVVKREPRLPEAHLGLGTSHAGLMQWRSAQKHYTKAAQLAPWDPRPVLGLAELLFEAGEMENALAILNQAEDRVLFLNAEYRALQAALLVRLSRQPRAMERLAQVGQYDPITPMADYWLGHYYLASDSAADAASFFRKACDDGAELRNACLCAGIALRQAGEWELAAMTIHKVLAMDSLWDRAHSELGLCYHEAGEIDSAIAYFRKSLAIRPHQNPALVDLGYSLVKDGQMDSADAAFRRAAKSKALRFRAHAGLGHTAMLTGQWSRAIEHLTRATKLEPGRAASYINLYGIYYRHGNWKKAEKTLVRADKAKAAIPGSHKMMGDALYLQRKYPQAVDAYAKALQEETDKNGARFGLAVSLYYANDFAGCATHVAPLMDDTTYAFPALKLRAQMYMTAGENENAIEDYERAVEKAPDDSVSLNNLAWLYTKAPTSERTEKAVVLAGTCVGRDSGNADFRDTYAQALWLVGDREAGMAQLQHARRLDRKRRKYWRQRLKELAEDPPAVRLEKQRRKNNVEMD